MNTLDIRQRQIDLHNVNKHIDKCKQELTHERHVLAQDIDRKPRKIVIMNRIDGVSMLFDNLSTLCSSIVQITDSFELDHKIKEVEETIAEIKKEEKEISYETERAFNSPLYDEAIKHVIEFANNKIKND